MDNSFALDLDAMKAWCDRNNIQYAYNEQLEQIGIPLPFGKGFMLRVIPRPSRNMLTFALPLPLQVLPALRTEVARAIALANAGTFMGGWILNHGKGELYFRHTVPVKGVSYDDASVRFLLDVVVGTVRQSGELFRQIIQKGAPAEVILQAFGAPAGESDAPTPEPGDDDGDD